MEDVEETGNSSSLLDDDNDRSQVRRYKQASTFRVGDTLKVVNSNGTCNGPYYIASVISVGVYTLSDAKGQEAEDGEEIEEKDLKAA
ncbi:hypothetical protein ST47_g6117 [Ascochyta rabiei]|uniref:Uncharacterized protein n=1 Tax=Didymella rabiei TaxID=5454 RepID=A0A163CW98_DIDRA|nr:hypothetical protein ST47_g6117 [Ascochyta rabiei]